MKTKTFIEKVEALGYEVDSFGTYLSARDSDGHDFATVSKKHRFVMDTDTFDFAMHVNDEDAEKIATLLFEYSATPPADREGEKRYRLRKLPIPLLDRSTEKQWLWRQRGTEIAGVDTVGVDHEKCQTIFTESELAEMDITGFEREEVE